ncbi:MAG: hypothetical protein MJ234_03495 [bacterium]|nr:hypothetical protein [bacterium]
MLHEDGKIIVNGADAASSDDVIFVSDSGVRIVRGGKGDDFVTVEGSKVGSVFTGKGDDTVIISGGSEVEAVQSGSGDDIITIRDSSVRRMSTGSGDDTIIINPGDRYFTCVIDGMKGNDRVIYKVGKGGGHIVFRGGEGCDALCIDSSSCNNFAVYTKKGSLIYKSEGFSDNNATKFIVKDVEILSVADSDGSAPKAVEIKNKK